MIFRFCMLDPFVLLDSSRAVLHEEGDPYYCQDAREEIATMVQDRFAVRFLTAVYVVIVHGCGIRLSFWDPSGTVFSKSFDYVKDPSTFCQFFWRISMLTDIQLGLDPTATPVLPHSDEYRLMNQLAEPREDDLPLVEGAVVDGDYTDPHRMFQFHRACYAQFVHHGTGPFVDVDARWKLSIPLPDGDSRQFLVAGAMRYQAGTDPDPRNGRTYLAVDCLTKNIVFLKDMWRYTDNVLREGQVLAQLNAAGVPHVPTLLCEAELPGQETRTPEFCAPMNADASKMIASADDEEDEDTVYKADSAHQVVFVLRHYRLVVRDLCVSLTKACKSGRQVVAMVRDCIYGTMLPSHMFSL